MKSRDDFSCNILSKEWRLALSKGNINTACCLVLSRLIGAKFGTRKMLHNLGLSLSELLSKFHSMHIKSLCVNTHTEKAANCIAGELSYYGYTSGKV